MIGSKIPAAKRLINNPSYPPVDPNDMSEANANNLMYLLDNIGTAEFVEDTRILIRHLAMLRCREQATPNLTVQVQAGIGWFAQNSYINFAGGNSPTITAPSGNPRRDIITLRNNGSIQVLNGAEDASPVAPTIPSTDIPLCQIYSRVGQVRIRDNDTQEGGQGYIEYDLRPFHQVAIGASAMPKIGLVARVQVTTIWSGSLGDTGLIDVVNFSGVGRVNSVHLHRTITGYAPNGYNQWKIIVDGVTLLDTGTVQDTGEHDLVHHQTDNASALQLYSLTGNPGGTDCFYFKSSLRIQQRAANLGGSNSVTVTLITTLDWEHE